MDYGKYFLILIIIILSGVILIHEIREAVEVFHLGG